MIDSKIKTDFLAILAGELIPAMGCTEPIALAFSGRMAVYQKEFIGKLSTFCGAVYASCAAGAAITYMVGGTVRQIEDAGETSSCVGYIGKVGMRQTDQEIVRVMLRK